MKTYFAWLFSIATLWLGLIASGYSSGAETRSKSSGVPTLLAACKAAPEYKKGGVIYSESSAKAASIRWSRKIWLQLFPKRLVYSIPTLEVKLYERSPQVPEGFDPDEELAFVLGRLRMPTESGCGLLVLEKGYYSVTRIVLYPVLANGTAGVGLELADDFADEDEKIVVSSELSKGRVLRIMTRLVHSVGGGSGTGSAKASKRELRYIWEFEKASGFVRKQ